MPQRWSRSLNSRWHHDAINGRMYKNELRAASHTWSQEWLYNHATAPYSDWDQDDMARFGYLVRKLRQYMFGFLRRARWRRLIKLVEGERRMELENVARRLDFSEL